MRTDDRSTTANTGRGHGVFTELVANFHCSPPTGGRRGMTQTRKLAAILAADVVGYSRLAGADEDRTLTRLRALRGDLIDPAIEANRGRVVKQTGDGILVEFRSVVDAVRCATEVQNGMIERNSGLPPERRIEFRIGIHLGDVVEESDGDLMGDGVNIAARLEGIAKPGTIYLSEQAYWQVKARLDLAINDLGKQSLKNIAEPVRVYSLEVANRRRRSRPSRRTKAAFDVRGAGGGDRRTRRDRDGHLARHETNEEELRDVGKNASAFHCSATLSPI